MPSLAGAEREPGCEWAGQHTKIGEALGASGLCEKECVGLDWVELRYGVKRLGAELVTVDEEPKTVRRAVETPQGSSCTMR